MYATATLVGMDAQIESIKAMLETVNDNPSTYGKLVTLDDMHQQLERMTHEVHKVMVNMMESLKQ